MRGARRCKQKWPFWMKNQHFGIPLLKWTKKWAFCVDPRMTKWGPRFSGWTYAAFIFVQIPHGWGGHKDVHLSVPTKHQQSISACIYASVCLQVHAPEDTAQLRESQRASENFT